MTSTPTSPLRVALLAAPLLLCDSLRVLLEGHAEVTIILEASAANDLPPFDVAIVTPGASHIPAEITLVLDDRPEACGGGRLVHADGTAGGRLDDLAAVIRFVATGSSRVGGVGGVGGIGQA